MSFEVVFIGDGSRSFLFPRPFKTKPGAIAAINKHAIKNPRHARNLDVRRVKK